MPIVKIVSLYAESHLPQKGWFQACIMCEVITSRTRLFKTIRNKSDVVFEIHTYLCPHCKKQLVELTFNNKYTTISNEMIDNQINLATC